MKPSRSTLSFAASPALGQIKIHFRKKDYADVDPKQHREAMAHGAIGSHEAIL
jgi:hypothetical protein